MLIYSPSSQQDYGTILCFANNAVGRQREPCQFHVIPAGKNQNTKSGSTECQIQNKEYKYSQLLTFYVKKVHFQKKHMFVKIKII